MKLSSRIQNDLGSQLMNNSLSVPLTMDGLSQHYGVSYTPIRQALDGLIEDGLIRKKENGRLEPLKPNKQKSIEFGKALKKFGLDPDMPDYEFKGLVKIEGIDEAIESLQELSNHLMILPKQASVGFGPINTPTNTGNNSPTVIADNSVNTSSNRTISPTVNVSSPLITHFASGGPGS